MQYSDVVCVCVCVCVRDQVRMAMVIAVLCVGGWGGEGGGMND
jgi:hypothetical protein